jgi:hypothetical protein|tara:strand:+ start:426 stop:596 length:171 start_codon:yes stop_codon:yes gene_type:complete
MDLHYFLVVPMLVHLLVHLQPQQQLTQVLVVEVEEVQKELVVMVDPVSFSSHILPN